MNIRDAKSEVIHTIRAYTVKNEWGSYAIPALRQRPLLLIGPPGIGKTAIMEQAANACGIGFVSYTMTHHTRQSAIGLPFIERRNFEGREYAVTEYTMSEIIASVFRCIEESGCREGLLFLDEINCVSETLAPAMLQFLQNKTFGSHRLSDGWILAAAGNPPEYNKSVREFDIATLDRLKYIEVEADYEAWRSYALEMNIHGAIIAYLDAHHDRFYVLKQTYTEKAFVTARGWEDLSCLLLQYEALNLPVTADLIGQYLHSEELAQDFAGYYQLFAARKKALPLAAMMQGEEDATQICRNLLDNASFDEKLNLVHLLLSAIGNELQDWKMQLRQTELLRSLQDKLQKFLKQQHYSELTNDRMMEFLKKEQDVLLVRKEHGLSSDREIEEMQRALYEMRTLFYRYRAETVAEVYSDSASGNCTTSSETHAGSVSGNCENSSETHVGSSSENCGNIPDVDSFCCFCKQYESSLCEYSLNLQRHLENSIRLLADADGAEFTLFLSSLEQNQTAQTFFRKYPSQLWNQHRERLSFKTREEELRRKLLSNTAP